MNSELLQLNDLVYNHRQWVCPVTGIEKNYVSVIEQHYCESNYESRDIAPIPLTVDILNRLGYYEIHKGEKGFNHFLEVRCRKQFKHPWYTQALNIDCSPSEENPEIFFIVNGEIMLQYVHDLQHVLRSTVNDDIIFENDKFYMFDKEYLFKYDDNEE